MPIARVAVLAFDGMSLFHLSVPGTVLGALDADASTRYEVRYCAPSPGLIRSDQGLEIQVPDGPDALDGRSEEHTSELQSLMRISNAVFCLKKKKEPLSASHNYIETHKQQH